VLAVVGRGERPGARTGTAALETRCWWLLVVAGAVDRLVSCLLALLLLLRRLPGWRSARRRMWLGLGRGDLGGRVGGLDGWCWRAGAGLLDVVVAERRSTSVSVCSSVRRAVQ